MVVGQSEMPAPQAKARRIGLAWEKLPHPRPRLTLQVIGPGGRAENYFLGPHDPALRPEDVELLHRLWLEVTTDAGCSSLHHRQILSVALRRLAASLRTAERDSIVAELRQSVAQHSRDGPR